MHLQAKSNLQRALGRPVALEEASGMTIGEIKALEGDSGDEVAATPAPADTPAPEAPPADSSKASAPLIHPAKIVDLEHDLPMRLPAPPAVIRVKENGTTEGAKKGINSAPSASSLYAPPTPDRKARIITRKCMQISLF